MKNPYEILGLDENSSFEELEQRYNQLKAEYSEGRFKSGAEGAEAARKLTELESAWQDIKSRQAVAEAVDGEGAGDFAYVDKLIKEQKYDEAQAVLDSMTVREGEGHFKWARGEMDFRCGEAFEIEQAGEYEVNGKCVFAVYRQK